MLRRCLFLPFLLLVVLLPVAVWSETVENLYEVEMLVVDQSETARREAVAEGLLAVLVKISGRLDVAQNPEVQRAQRSSERYMLEFSYGSSDKVTEIEIDGQLVLQPMIGLKVGYSRQAISGLLRTAGLPIWSSNRPVVLPWVVIDKGGQRQFLNSLNSPDIQNFMQEEFSRRGLPEITPLFDLEDQLSLDAHKVWQLDMASIQSASGRYQSDAVLVGRVAETSAGQYRGNWNFLFQEQTYVIDARTASLEDFVREGIDGVVQVLSQRYAINTLGTEGMIYLEVSGVSSFSDYAQITRHLSDLEPVNAVHIQEVSGQWVRYEVTADGGLKLFQELVELGGLLKLSDDRIIDQSGERDYRYDQQWLHYQVVGSRQVNDQ